MKLFLLSKTDNLNEDLRLRLSEEIQRRGGKIAYISSAKQTGVKKYYNITIEDIKSINPNCELDYFDLSYDFSDSDLEKIKEYKIVYLSGGNTYAFLKDAKDRNLKEILNKVIENDGLIIGISAGSIMMTPRINIAEHGDVNEVELEDLTGFNFVSFEFHPHFENEDLEWIMNYKKENNANHIYLCKDGDGIEVSESDFITYGGVSVI